MIRIESGVVTKILREAEGIREIEVLIDNKPERAIQYTRLSAPVVPGEGVLLNTSAVRLGLGTGGYHFVLPKAAVSELDRNKGHIMKLRYTPGQVCVLSCEEPEHPAHQCLKDQDSLQGMPVVAAELHSMMPAIAATVSFLAENETEASTSGLQGGFGQNAGSVRRPRVAYVMTDGAALPLWFSRTVEELKSKGLICGTVTTGHAYGGDLEAINVYSGLLAARHVLDADLAIVTMGPGIVGTGTKFGHTGIEQGMVINAAASLNGTAVACPRISFSDSRSRHYGVSHHTLTSLAKVALTGAYVPVPELEPERLEIVMGQLEEAHIQTKHKVLVRDGSVVKRAAVNYDLRLSTMGRSLAEDESFFLAAGATALWAMELLNGMRLSASVQTGRQEGVS
ncbi:DUF3866 family protein [Effusibacillus lacus]|uniref:DUF3866 domain-containing protein n=1 Tax=Effusibacillus lacus TaxID=1348429 RepID=A0A292YRR8_9BACL|nr:DUF3866 family protein [Effusibacillus lacus]TCS76333.1 uncharacterized protein DUF3866 [Effusibacillus lacus]GAX91876.1 hypothetical protein EFBL_3567 [Effusibacillus lacus]